MIPIELFSNSCKNHFFFKFLQKSQGENFEKKMLFPTNSVKSMLIRLYLHREFKHLKKILQEPTVFEKNIKYCINIYIFQEYKLPVG